MALSATDLLTVRSHVGTAPTDAELNALAASFSDQPLPTALQWVSQKLADLEATPGQFALTGRYSQNTAANITALQKKKAALEALVNPNSTAATGLPELTQGRLTRAPVDGVTSRVPDTEYNTVP